MSKKDPSGRLARWALKLQEYQIEIGYRPGKRNQNADFLSRIPIASILTIKLNWSADQKEDKYCSRIISELSTAKIAQNKYRLVGGELLTVDGRVIVPSSRRQDVLAINHDHMLSGHLGIEKTYSRLKRQYKWPGMKKDIAEYVNSCIECNKRKPYGATKAPLISIATSPRIWERIAMDIVGQISECESGYKYILVVSDYATRYVITIPMADQRAETVAKHLVVEILTRFGAPQIILSDQGTNFQSKLVKYICELFNIKQTRTTPYHPQTDGLVERFNRTLCDMLHLCSDHHPNDWHKILPFVTMAYNSVEHSSTNENPFYLFFGRDPIMPNELNINNRERNLEDNDQYLKHWQQTLQLANQNLKDKQEIQKRYYYKSAKIRHFKEGDDILIKKGQVQREKFYDRWDGPYKITKQLSDVNYEVKDGEGNTQVTHVNRTKKILSRSENQALIIKKKAGRPKKENTLKRKRGRPKKITPPNNAPISIPIPITEPLAKQTVEQTNTSTRYNLRQRK